MRILRPVAHCARIEKMVVIPRPQAGKRRVVEISSQVIDDTRHVSQISVLAVALREARENAQDLRIPLSAKQGISAAEILLVCADGRCSDAVAIERKQPLL